MKIEAVKNIENGFMTQGFAFGGEEGPEKFDNSIKYRSSIQNFLIDTGDDVILVCGSLSFISDYLNYEA